MGNRATDRGRPDRSGGTPRREWEPFATGLGNDVIGTELSEFVSLGTVFLLLTDHRPSVAAFQWEVCIFNHLLRSF